MALVDTFSTERVPKVIGPAQHAMLDYGVAATFFALGARMMRRHRPAATLAFINGAMVLGMSLFTNYPGGVWRRISFPTHGTLDVVQAGLAGLGPVLFGFAKDPEARPFYSQALNELMVVSATDWHATRALPSRSTLAG